MRLHRHAALSVLPIDLDTAWGFFSDPRNLALMTPPALNLIPTSELPDVMHPGLIVEYSISPALGLRVNWVTEITHVVEGRLFVDEQRSGPYRFWHHQHHFRAVEGGTEMRDIVHYALPFGLPGDLLGGTFVQERVERIFKYRASALDRLFGQGSDAGQDQPPVPVTAPVPLAAAGTIIMPSERP